MVKISMFKNKKAPQNEVNSEETFSLTSFDIPVIKEEPAPMVQVQEPAPLPLEADKPSEQPKEKGPNVLWAKILVAMIIGFVSVLGLYKFVDYLNMPKVLFSSVVESTYHDFLSILNTIGNDTLYRALSMNSYEISVDSKVVSSNLGSSEEHLEEVLNTLKYISNVKVDRSAGTVNANTRGMKDNVEKFTLNYIENERKKYVNIPLVHDQYIEMKNDIDVIKFSPELGKRVLDQLKSEFSSLLEEEKFSFKNVSIGVNGKTVDCLRSSYKFDSGKMNILVDRLYNAIKMDDVSYVFLAYMLGMDTKGLDAKFEELKSNLGLSFDGIYEISAYTRRDNKEPVRLELYFVDKSSGSVEKTVSYSRDNGYLGFEIKRDSSGDSLTIKGNLDGMFTVSLSSNGNVSNLTLRSKGNGKEGAISIVDSSNETKFEAKFFYNLESTSNSSHSVGMEIELKDYEMNGGAVYKISSDALIKEMRSIAKPEDITNSIGIEEYETETGTSLSEKFKTMLRNISIGDIQPPQVFTSENSGEIPTQE